MNRSEVFRVVRALLIFALAVGALWIVIMIRDYKLEVQNGLPTFVSRISIPRPTNVNFKNHESRKLTLSCSSQANVAGYEFQLSGYSNMFFPHSYQSAEPKKEVGKLKSGKTYYARVRCYKKNERGRIVYGRWSGITKSTTKEDTDD